MVPADGDEPRAVPAKIPGGVRPGYSPTLFLYEHTPGGIGLTQRIFERRQELLERARSLIAGCPCKAGCPACTGPSDAAGYGHGHTRKTVALELLGAMFPLHA
jgi:DEAD/DEAH box helicase domain-containing protein